MTSGDNFRLLVFFGNRASMLMRFLRLILARASGVPFLRELRRPSDGMLPSSEDRIGVVL